MPAMSFLALAIYTADAPLYGTYASLPSPWGPQALADQRNAAVLMWVAGNLALVVAMLLVATSWKRHDDEAQRRIEAREDAAVAAAHIAASRSPHRIPGRGVGTEDRDRRDVVACIPQVVGAAPVDREHDALDQTPASASTSAARRTWCPVVLTSSIRQTRAPAGAMSFDLRHRAVGLRFLPNHDERTVSSETAATSSVAAPSGAARWSMPSGSSAATSWASSLSSSGRSEQELVEVDGRTGAGRQHEIAVQLRRLDQSPHEVVGHGRHDGMMRSMATRGAGWYPAVGRPLFFALPPETSHRIATALLGLPLRGHGSAGSRPTLRSRPTSAA